MPLEITDALVATARRMRLGKNPYSWEQIAAHLDVSMLRLMERCDRRLGHKSSEARLKAAIERRQARAEKLATKRAAQRGGLLFWNRLC